MANGNYSPGQHVVCPHCGRSVRLLECPVYAIAFGNKLPENNGCRIDDGKKTAIFHMSMCPACNRAVVELAQEGSLRLVIPATTGRRPLHSTVPKPVRDDYEEASLILSLSPKASAALSRRCLQTLLVLQGAKSSDLVDQLKEIYPNLPGYVQPYVDHIRKLGNISAHAKQSKSTGEIVDVEVGEADWMLELLDELCDHFYTKPAEAKAKQAALDAKFADAGKLKS